MRSKEPESLPGIETKGRSRLLDRRVCSKEPESLPGIETDTESAYKKGSHVPKSLNPFQGLKLRSRLAHLMAATLFQRA